MVLTINNYSQHKNFSYNINYLSHRTYVHNIIACDK